MRIELAAAGSGTRLVLDHARIEATRGMAAMRFWFAALAGFPLEAR